ncbi:MAG: cysteine desulfurase family protein [Candidatus Komeilibacteria bacterium]
MKRIYFDYAATTPMHKSVAVVMDDYASKTFGNPSSQHWFGQQARAAVESVRQQIADDLFCQPNELLFTSGATESDNLALGGVINYWLAQWREVKRQPHIIISAFEHPAVLSTALAWERRGVQVTLVNPLASGVVDVEDIKKAITDNTVLLSLMYVNNEIGTVQPVQVLGKYLLELNKERQANNLGRISYHIDAVQALNYLNCRPDHLRADLMSFSGHKIYGPKGVGILYLRHGTPFVALQTGGAQENGRRAGTLNVPGIVGMGKAMVQAIADAVEQGEKIKALQQSMEKQLQQRYQAIINCQNSERAPHISNLRIPGLNGEQLAVQLDLEGIAISTGSACSSGSTKPSVTLSALGLDKQAVSESVRVSLGMGNKHSDIVYFFKVLDKIIKNNV